MIASMRSEWRKLWATPTMWWLLLGMIGLTVVAAGGAFALQEAGHQPRTSDFAIRTDLHAIGSGSIMVAIAGMIGMAGEFRNGQADQTFISTPKRGTVLLSKIVVYTGLGLAYGLVAAAVCLATMWGWLGYKGDEIPWTHSLWLTVAGAVLSAAVFGVLGVAVGGATKNQVAAIVGTLTWIVIVEPILFQADNDFGKWLPGQAAEALRRVPTGGILTMTAGGIVLCAWTAAVLVVATYRLTRQDI